jgi:hypothetical protein
MGERPIPQASSEVDDERSQGARQRAVLGIVLGSILTRA